MNENKSCCSIVSDLQEVSKINLSTCQNSKDYDKRYIDGFIETKIGAVPKVYTKLNGDDYFGAIKTRCGFGRMNYKVTPGIYAVGNPTEASHVLVTANYKLTFDALRKELKDFDAWILVLDTDGVNVWCAAGKGTFGTRELENRIKSSGLNSIVEHRTLILPQLGAPGISAHQIFKNTGFKVVYGPVRATDIKEFVSAGLNATKEMRTVKFSLYDRLVLTPMEITGSIKATLIIFGVLFILNVFSTVKFGAIDFYGYIGALIMGCILTPALLPFIPGRAFALKGWLLGIIWAVALILLNNIMELSILRAVSYIMILPVISSFYAMNFTGASTYTSLSGVLKEMKASIPLMVISMSMGIILILVNSFMGI